MSILWDSLKSEDYTPEEKWGLLEDAEAHLGLPLTNLAAVPVLKDTDIPKEVRDSLTLREAARTSKDFAAADRLRSEIENSGYRVDDGPNGPVLTKRTL